jgi:hypothetical protein
MALTSMKSWLVWTKAVGSRIKRESEGPRVKAEDARRRMARAPQRHGGNGWHEHRRGMARAPQSDGGAAPSPGSYIAHTPGRHCRAGGGHGHRRAAATTGLERRLTAHDGAQQREPHGGEEGVFCAEVLADKVPAEAHDQALAAPGTPHRAGAAASTPPCHMIRRTHRNARGEGESAQ